MLKSPPGSREDIHQNGWPAALREVCFPPPRHYVASGPSGTPEDRRSTYRNGGFRLLCTPKETGSSRPGADNQSQVFERLQRAGYGGSRGAVHTAGWGRNPAGMVSGRNAEGAGFGGSEMVRRVIRKLPDGREPPCNESAPPDVSVRASEGVKVNSSTYFHIPDACALYTRTREHSLIMLIDWGQRCRNSNPRTS